MGLHTSIPKSSTNLDNQMSCVLVDDATRYSTSGVDSATMGFFVLLQETRFPPKRKAYPEVLFRSSKLPTQSTSMYATTFESLIEVLKNP